MIDHKSDADKPRRSYVLGRSMSSEELSDVADAIESHPGTVGEWLEHGRDVIASRRPKPSSTAPIAKTESRWTRRRFGYGLLVTAGSLLVATGVILRPRGTSGILSVDTSRGPMGATGSPEPQIVRGFKYPWKYRCPSGYSSAVILRLDKRLPELLNEPGEGTSSYSGHVATHATDGIVYVIAIPADDCRDLSDLSWLGKATDGKRPLSVQLLTLTSAEYSAAHAAEMIANGLPANCRVSSGLIKVQRLSISTLATDDTE